MGTITALLLAAASAAAAGGGAPRALPAGQDLRVEAAREAASERYEGELLRALEASSQPRELLLAARLRRGEAVQAGRRGDGATQMRQEAAADALLQRAIARGADDPVVWWEVANACHRSPALCAADDAVLRLRELAPHNAAVWLRPQSGATPGDDAGPRLARIAAASRYDSYLAERLRAWTLAHPEIRVPPELTAEVGGDPTMARAVLAFGYLFADVGFEHAELRGMCGKETLAVADASRAAACRAALDRLLAKADTLIAYYTAWNVRHALETDAAARATLQHARDRIEWQVAAMTELSLAGDPQSSQAVQAEQVSLWLAPGATEFTMLGALLDAHGIPATPPAGWRSTRAIEAARAIKAP